MDTQSLSRTTSLENIPAPLMVRRVPINREPDSQISYETEAEVMRTYRLQDERRRHQEERGGLAARYPRPSTGKFKIFLLLVLKQPNLG